MTTLFTYHPGWIIVALLLGLAYAVIMYYREKILTDIKATVKWLLAGTRFLSVFLMALLLIGIILEHYNSRKEKPLIFVVQDNSESVVQTKDSTFYKTTYQDSVQNLIKKLKEKFDVVTYTFSNEVAQKSTPDYQEKVTDISNALNKIYDQYNNRNIGGVILATDGIYNQGINPLYTVSRKPHVPVFTIGLGDTSSLRDIYIQEVRHNEVAFLGNQFAVEIVLGQNGFEGKKIELSILEKGKSLQKHNVEFKESGKLVKVPVVLNTKSTGFVKYTVSIKAVEGEFTLKNNTRNFYVNVIDGRQKILLTYSGVHPDVSALRYAIEQNKNYELFVESIEGLRGSLDKYDLIITHNYKTGNQGLDEIVSSNKKPVFHIIGVNSDLKALSDAGIGFKGDDSGTEDMTFSRNSNFQEIIYDSELLKYLELAPPLKSPMGNITFSSSLKVLAFQKVGSINLSSPLLYFNEKSDNKYGVLFGEGLWRWRLFDQMRQQNTGNFITFFSKIINYLAIKDNKDPFKVIVKNEFEANEKIVVRAELYNASYDLINNPDVSFKLIDETGKALDYQFYRTTSAYKLELGRLKEGIYNWESSTALNGERHLKKGTFLVKEVKKELLDLSANHRILNQLAENTNAGFYTPKEISLLEKDLFNKEDIVSVVYQEKAFDDLIDYKWIFFLLIGLLSLEWFVRKFQGGY